MQQRTFLLFGALCAMIVQSCTQSTAPTSNRYQPSQYPEQYQADWESLAEHPKVPEWFADSKLGIYFHWGLYSVPAYSSEWYSKWMHVPNPPKWGAGSYEHHKETYGDPSEFGYHDFIPMFKGEQFDPADWAKLFKQAGAKFAGPVAIHHDGFAMWHSAVNPWNVGDQAIQRDVLGEMFEELRKEDLKTLATFHHAWTHQKYPEDTTLKGSFFPYNEDYFTSTTDPELRKFYGNLPQEEYFQYWLNMTTEVVDKYSPDLTWFDSDLDQAPELFRQSMVAHTFNAAHSRNQEIGIICKQEDLPANIRILDIEQGGLKEMPQDPWMTDITLSNKSWGYVQGQTYKELPLLIRNMIDVWSKKGIVLLNISPRSDGVINQEQRDLLKGLGAWMDHYGRAVYGTQNHEIYGYGDAAIHDGHFGGQAATIKYSEQDVRFTRSKDGTSMFVFLLGQPEEGTPLEIRHLLDGQPGAEIHEVISLADGSAIEWSYDEVLRIQAPKATEMNEIATVFEVRLK
ncbi:alpha-L-fucosidase [Pontibacter sp. G13]|uniref:alpha-L-fucosidase n=1 Tax=Pontibacter sp. G13 TaxID=3074898 RepID=UPI00288AE7B7|nr:alpha-L-fucosidase [Pontibacter sp. G13]WNJ19061.1 alpha-L-fucosidase [Pontibacter sp. G13]